MEKLLIWELLITLEEHISDDEIRKQIYLDLLPTICLFDLESASDINDQDPVFAEAYAEWIEKQIP